MKKILLRFFLLLPLTATAQQSSPLDLRLQARGDYQREYVSGEAVKDNCGFKGKFLNLIISGEVGQHFSYAYRQRLNRISKSSEFFDATDWLYLQYKPTPRWTFAAGKQIVAIGGFEYDRAPIDLYFCSEYWNNIACYQWGASAAFGLRGGRDELVAQFCQSPFRAPGEDTYAYNLMWRGVHGPYSALCSFNMLEYAQGKFLSYIALGQAVQLGAVRLELDVMNRATAKQAFLLRDCTLVGEAACRPAKWLNVYAKASYDVNRTHHEGDRCVLPGTELTRIGGGLEYYPLQDERIRLHANYCYTLGKNANTDGVLRPRQSLFNIGLTWKADLLHLKKKPAQSHND
ncbi:MAG: porin [Alloprevotella sp.]|nr:porin [Alloprevotella sp.]